MTDKITTVLWDVDGTLLDFIAAEKAAIRKLFKEYDLGECTDEMLARYSKINRTYWVKLENGEMTKPEILVGRFRDFFVSEGLDPSIASAFNEKYQDRLGDADSIVYCDDSLNLLKSLRGKIRQYAVSNGTIAAQTKKLKLSGVPEEKFDFGLPFYARPTDHDTYWYDYAGFSDKLDENGYYYDSEIDKTFWFNRPADIAQKTQYALDKGFGGVMIWHYTCDLPSSDPKSLLGAIGDTVNNYKPAEKSGLPC